MWQITLCLSFVNQYFSSLALDSAVFFTLPVFFFSFLNCSHAHKAQPISLWVHLINMVQREEKQSSEDGASVKRGNLSEHKNTLSLSPFCLFLALQPGLQVCSREACRSSSTPTTDGAPASARDFPTLAGLYKLCTITEAPATREEFRRHTTLPGGPPAPSALLICCSFSSPTPPPLFLPVSKSGSGREGYCRRASVEQQSISYIW